MVESTSLRGLASVLRIIAIVAVLFVVAGLIGFVTDEVSSSSKASATRITQIDNGQPTVVTVDISQPDPPAAIERIREQQHSSGREVIDDVDDALFRPFSWIGRHRAPWVQRLICTGLALFFYGFVLLWLAGELRLTGDKARRRAISARERAAEAERRASGTYASPA
jgi:predicted PurR-regulated permease PerM